MEHDGERSQDERLRDHAAIERLSDELLPALIVKLGASGLGEIEVREGGWKVRLRRPVDAGEPKYGRRAGDRPSRSQPGHAGHGHAPAAIESHRSGRDSAPGRESAAGARGRANGAHGDPTAVGPGLDPGARIGRMGHLPDADVVPELPVGPRSPDAGRAVATSPAVGIFQPRAQAGLGVRIRAGDRLATVDVLGVPHEVVAPVDGRVGASLVEPGQAVEYGQELIRIELAEPAGREA